ncbi:MAG: tetratricopeptide repeat protein [Planctomycetaceae bacterium]
MSAEIFQPNMPANSLPIRFNALVVLLLFLAVWLAHGRSLRGEFVFDDKLSILDNPSIRSLSSLGTVLRGNKFTTVAGRPMLNLSLAVNYAWGGIHPGGYHLFNYGVHAAGAVLLFGLLRRILATFPQTSSAAGPLALAISLIWSVHPLTINAVSYVVQRGESMTSLCYLTVLWGFVKGVQTSQRRWFVVSVLAAWLGSLTKEIIATVPLTAIALDVLVLTGDWRLALRRHWGMFLGLMTAWVPLAFCMITSQSRENTIGYGMGVTLQNHIQTQVWAVAHYLQLVIWPNPLVFDYGPEFVVTDVRQLLVAGVVLATFLSVLLWLVVRRSPLAFPGVMLCLLLGPSSAIPIITQTVAEHRMYLASACGIAWLVLVLYLAFKRLPSFSESGTATQCCVMGVLLVPVVLMLGVRTAQRSNQFLTERSIWSDTLLKRPLNQRPYLALAQLINENGGDNSEALRLCDQGIPLPGPYTRHLLEIRGSVRVKAGQLEPALEDFTRAIALDSTIIEDRYHRATILRDLGRYDEALRDLDEARRIDPTNLATDFVQGTVHSARGDLLLALDCFDRLLARDSQHLAAQRRRISVYAKLNRWGDAQRAIQRLQRAGQIVDPKLVREVEEHYAKSPK